MISPGLTSVTFRKLSPRQVLDLMVQARHKGIEWGGDVHVPPTNLNQARKVAGMTADSGVSVAAYGSYYRLGEAPGPGGSFEQVLDTAVAIGAPVIRVWAGLRGPGNAGDADFQRVADDLRRCAELAAQAGIIVATESHRDTLTETPEASARLFSLTAHPNARTLWQPLMHTTREGCLESLKSELPRMEHLHVFQRDFENPSTRLPLSEGADDWAAYLAAANPSAGHRWALLEFVVNDDPQQYLRDAAALDALLTRLD